MNEEGSTDLVEEREVRADVFQRSASIFVALLLCFPVYAVITTAFPHSFPKNLRIPVSDTDLTSAAVISLLVLLLGVYIVAATFCTLIRCDAAGVYQRHFFGQTFVKWEDITGYRYERLRNTRWNIYEPVLLSTSQDVLLRPVANVIVAIPSADQKRAEFWCYVASVIDSRKAP